MQGKPKNDTPALLARRYEEHAQGQRILVLNLSKVRRMLNKLDRSFRCLLADEHFVTLLRAEGLDRVPDALLKRVRE
jgi:ParB family chromosome partitioning protein